jgi:hypothetical protein
MNQRKTARFKSLTDAARFYGVSRRGFFGFKAAGMEAGDLLPYDAPEQMPQGFERRGRPCPPAVMARAVEAAGATQARRRAPAPNGNGGTGDSSHSSPPAVQLTLGEEGSLESIMSGQRRLHAALAGRYEQFILDGEQESAPALALYRRMVDLKARILARQKAARELRDTDQWMRVADVEACAAQFARDFHRLIQRELVSEFPASERERVMAAMDRVGERLPLLMSDAVNEAA